MNLGKAAGESSDNARAGLLRGAALAFAVLALVAGGLQIAAYVSSGFLRHLILGGFACAVGISVAGAVAGSVIRSRKR
ncbi:MAG: hypothetical protein AB7G47_14230 [Mycolicibacterium sp.]|uniref:hypothetical protein n=1 Tax=Mycolicibacterium sp. TaxID=2320850 RepID=UPI003D14B5B1